MAKNTSRTTIAVVRRISMDQIIQLDDFERNNQQSTLQLKTKD